MTNFTELLKAIRKQKLWLKTATSADNLSVYALKTTNGSPQWRYQLPNALFSVSIMHGLVYATTLNGTIYALKASDGMLLWKH